MKHRFVINAHGKLFDNNSIQNIYSNFISQHISSSAGKQALTQAMAAPIRRNLDYQGVARQVLVVEPMPQGAPSIYDKKADVISTAENFKPDKFVINSHGKLVNKNFIGRVTFPKFEVFSNPTVKIDDVKKRRFSLIDRAVQKTKQEIMAQEDEAVFNALNFKNFFVINSKGKLMKQFRRVMRSLDYHNIPRRAI